MNRNSHKGTSHTGRPDDRQRNDPRVGSIEECPQYYLSGPCDGMHSQVRLQPGEILLKRFTIESCLGTGRFGRVYLARDDVRSAQVALKVTPLASECAAHRALCEIKLNSAVSEYKHVIRIHDMHPAMHKGVVLLIISMEYADHGSLRDWLMERRDNIRTRRSEGVDLFVQACWGVRVLHSAGIVHGDLKPENLLRVGGDLKVSDLGLSRDLHDTDVSSTGARESDAPSCGTPAYMSPEQFLAAHPDDVDFRSDVYALGILLFEICHPRCRPPFGGSYAQLRERHLHMSVSLPEGLETHLVRVIARCLQKRPADRYQDVSDLLADLSDTGDEKSTAADHDATPETVDEQVLPIWEHACQSVEQGDLAVAARCCDRILRIAPEHSDAKYMLDDIQGRYEQARRSYQAIERNIGYQTLDGLSVLLAQAVETYPNHPEGSVVQTQLLTIAEQYRDVISEGIVAIGQKRLGGAVACFERARQLNPGLPVIAEGIDYVKNAAHQVEMTRALIDSALEQGDQPRAMYLARTLDQYVEEISSTVLEELYRE